MKIDKTKLYDFYYTDEQGNQFPVENVSPVGTTITYHSAFACQRHDSMRIVSATGKDIDLGTLSKTWSNDLVTAMVRSGDFTAKEAIIVETDCCERCLNILRAKYLGEKITVESYLSSKWDRPCRFCEPADDKYITPQQPKNPSPAITPTELRNTKQ